MEQFNSKLYEKYTDLKKRKLLEEDDFNTKRDSQIKTYQFATEDLIEELKNENDQLRSQIASLQDQYAECQKQLLEDSKKQNELSNEVGRLQNLLLKKNDNNNSSSPRSPCTSPTVRSSPRLRSGVTYKGSSKKTTANSCTIESGIQHKEAASLPFESREGEQYVPDCCRRNVTSSGGTIGKGEPTCVFQALIEFLVGMNLSLKCQTEGLCLSVVHQRSGYTFTLTWIRHGDGRDAELMYHVTSLGTLEKVALDWMKEDMVFSMAMCPVFFERISRVVGHS